MLKKDKNKKQDILIETPGCRQSTSKGICLQCHQKIVSLLHCIGHRRVTQAQTRYFMP